MTEQRHDLAGGDRQVDSPNGPDPAEMLVHAAQIDGSRPADLLPLAARAHHRHGLHSGIVA
jgi:hypothetical protein